MEFHSSSDRKPYELFLQDAVKAYAAAQAADIRQYVELLEEAVRYYSTLGESENVAKYQTLLKDVRDSHLFAN